MKEEEEKEEKHDNFHSQHHYVMPLSVRRSCISHPRGSISHETTLTFTALNYTTQVLLTNDGSVVETLIRGAV